MRTTQPILSLERLRRYRLEAGLSERALARATVMTSMSISALEEGRNHDELSLRHIVRVAGVLNVDPATLFHHSEELEPAPDDVAVEAALAAIGKYTSTQQLAAGLDWTLERTVHALERLRTRLAGTGQRLAVRNGKIKLAPAAGTLTDTQERAVAYADLQERGLTLSLAALLRQALDGRVDAGWHRRANADDLVAQASLLKLGFAEFRDGWLEPTSDVHYCLAPGRGAGVRRKRAMAG